LEVEVKYGEKGCGYAMSVIVKSFLSMKVLPLIYIVENKMVVVRKENFRMEPSYCL
jgi:hypothetical protein